MNSNHRCPTWCATDHQKTYANTPDGRELRFQVHVSALIRRNAKDDHPMSGVRLIDYGSGENPVIGVWGKTLTLARAREVAGILSGVTEFRSVADDIRLALWIARSGGLPSEPSCEGLRSTISGASIADAAR